MGGKAPAVSDFDFGRLSECFAFAIDLGSRRNSDVKTKPAAKANGADTDGLCPSVGILVFIVGVFNLYGRGASQKVSKFSVIIADFIKTADVVGLTNVIVEYGSASVNIFFACIKIDIGNNAIEIF